MAHRGSAAATSYQLQQSGGKSQLWTDYYSDSEDTHPEYFMSEEARNRINFDETLSDYDKMVIQKLAMRKFHIPGNSYWEDWSMWFNNNHPFFCFCFADSRHPLGKRERVMNLLATVAFGLAATCGVVLWFHYEERDFNATLVNLYGFDISIGMVVLFIFAGPVHVAFDLSMFFVQACPPCRTGGLFAKHLPESHQKCWLWLGAHVAFLVTMASLALAINVMLLRASIEDDGTDTDLAVDVKAYAFVGMYCAEVIIANFVIFPICTFTVFSGVLGCCGLVPGIGGRPYQVKKCQRIKERKEKKRLRKSGMAEI